jgi:hypothetical protein
VDLRFDGERESQPFTFRDKTSNEIFFIKIIKCINNIEVSKVPAWAYVIQLTTPILSSASYPPHKYLSSPHILNNERLIAAHQLDLSGMVLELILASVGM